MSDTFTITRRIEIDAAHRVPHHGSKCYAIHGHRYVIEAKCAGPVIDSGEQRGMVMDFGFLKECMMDTIHDECDHGLILWHQDPILDGILLEDTWWKLRLIDVVPTAENLAKIWYDQLQHAIKEFFTQRHEPCPKLVEVKVWETPNCSAVYPWAHQ
jgi:6-pyruvoyltetrahydropterin/6-carboxytetrahydropterin synthase